MLNVVCSEYCSESVVTCFVCKELGTERIQRQQGPDLSNGKFCTAKAIQILAIRRVDSLLKFPHSYVECCLF